MCVALFSCVFFNDTATTEIYTSDTLFPYTTLFRSLRTMTGHGLPSSSPISSGRQRARATSAHTWSIRTPYMNRSEEHTSELQSLMRISYAVFCLKKKKTKQQTHT